jgi:hypothetical protein
MTCLTPWEDRVRNALQGYNRTEAVVRFASSPTINANDRDAVITYLEEQLNGHWKASTGKRPPEGAPNFSFVTSPLNVRTRGTEALGLMAYLAQLSGQPLEQQTPEAHANWVAACQATRHTGKADPRDIAPNGMEASVIRRGYYRFWVAQSGPELAYVHANWPSHDETRVHPLRMATWTDILTVLATRAKKLRTRCLFVLSITAIQNDELWALRSNQFYTQGPQLWIHLDPSKSFKAGRRHPVMIGAAVVKEYLASLKAEQPKLLFADPADPDQPQPGLPGIISSLGDGLGPISRERLRNTFIATLLNVDEDVGAWLLQLMGTRDLQHLDRIRTLLKSDPKLRAELLLPVEFGPTFDTHYCPAGHANRAGDLECKVCHRILPLDALTPAGMAKTALIKLVLQLYERGLQPDDLAHLALKEP